MQTRAVLDLVEGFADLLTTDPDDPAFRTLRASEGNGRPLGNADFIARLERRLVARRAPGRKPKTAVLGQLDLLNET